MERHRHDQATPAKPRGWTCEPPGDRPRVEALAAPSSLVLCLWYCEDAVEGLQEELARLGLDLKRLKDGPCTHDH